MELQGIGDPSGRGEGFSFIRIVRQPDIGTMLAGPQPKAVKGVKLAGTNRDLRVLTIDDMTKLLHGFGMHYADIKSLNRWDMVTF